MQVFVTSSGRLLLLVKEILANYWAADAEVEIVGGEIRVAFHKTGANDIALNPNTLVAMDALNVGVFRISVEEERRR